MTSDPFLGLVRGPSSLRFAEALQTDAAPWRRSLTGWRLALTIVLLKRALRGVWHLYPSPIARLHPQAPAHLSYSNPAAVQSPRGAAVPPRWLFVLSKADWHSQARGGAAAFVEQFAARLREALSLGRRVEVVAPPELQARTVEVLGLAEGVDFVDEPDFDGFMARLRSAEHVFFWNFYSFSIVHRVMTAQPVFFFGEGHMVEILPALHEAGIRLFYDGWRPPLLDIAQPFDSARLSLLERETRGQFERIRAGLRACQSPRDLLQHVVSADDAAVLKPQSGRP